MLFRRLLTVAALMLAGSAFAAYPDRPIRLIAPFAPGGNIDITARTIAPGLTEQLGQSVIVENRGGAGGRIGTEVVAKSAPDGYTLLLGSSGSLTVNPALPVYSAQEFIALAKSRPGQVMMASAGTGSNTHLTGELFQVITGVKLTHVPYKGSGPALIDLIGGQTHCIFD